MREEGCERGCQPWPDDAWNESNRCQMRCGEDISGTSVTDGCGRWLIDVSWSSSDRTRESDCTGLSQTDGGVKTDGEVVHQAGFIYQM